MMKYVFVSLGLLLFVSCNNAKQVTSTSSTSKNQEKNVASANPTHSTPETKPVDDSVTTQQSSEPDSLFAFFRKTACFGRCPSYSMTIYKSGYAVYEGFSFVDKKGKYTTHFPKSTLTQIKRTAESIHYFGLRDSYKDPRIQDVPSTFTQLQYGGKSKKIETALNVPPTLQRFESLLEGIYKKADWKKIEK